MSNNIISKSNGKSYDELYKLIIVGDSCVGKTSILQRFHGEHFPLVAVPTIGIDFRIRTITIQNKVIKLQIWDTSGQEKYNSITTSYYRGTMGVLLVYDITNRNSFDHITKRWIKHIQQNVRVNTLVILLGNKCDMEAKREVSRDIADALAIQYGYMFLETSAKENINLEKAFYDIAYEIFLKILKSFDANLIETNRKERSCRRVTWDQTYQCKFLYADGSVIIVTEIMANSLQENNEEYSAPVKKLKTENNENTKEIIETTEMSDNTTVYLNNEESIIFTDNNIESLSRSECRSPSRSNSPKRNNNYQSESSSRSRGKSGAKRESRSRTRIITDDRCNSRSRSRSISPINGNQSSPHLLQHWTALGTLSFLMGVVTRCIVNNCS